MDQVGTVLAHLGIPDTTPHVLQRLRRLQRLVRDPILCPFTTFFQRFAASRRTCAQLRNTLSLDDRVTVAALVLTTDRAGSFDFEEFRKYLENDLVLHLHLHVSAGYEMSTSALVCLLVCAVHNYLFIHDPAPDVVFAVNDLLMDTL